MNPSPVFIAGPDRSGTTLLYALLASHPNISMVRRTNMWRYFYRRYGDLSDPENLERCLQAMVRFRRMRHLAPDPDRIRREMQAGEATYGRLFALFHEHVAQRAGKPRWGDKSLHTEHYARDVIREFPKARIIHIVRDPRDRYASLSRRYGQRLSRVGGGTARWLLSVRAAFKNLVWFPDNYLLIRFEDLLTAPEATLQTICAFIGEDFSMRMLTMDGARDLKEEGNSSFEMLRPRRISTKPIGRFKTILSEADIQFIQLAAGPQMKRLGYPNTAVHFSPVAKIRFYAAQLPLHAARMAGALWLEMLKFRHGEKIPERHMRSTLHADWKRHPTETGG